ncbi:VanZ like family protein [Microbacterium terrae]|uniref:VanZ like family protein n=2 Tax=Microbacterium terrae TaxID=69369 RepID=A0A0M2H4E7_9MICO|nr:VanZ like family protein [Microbacterium terrae]
MLRACERRGRIRKPILTESIRPQRAGPEQIRVGRVRRVWKTRRMGAPVMLGFTAVGLSAVVAIAVFVPFIAWSYRRTGGFGFARFALWAGALVSLVAILAYTLLPLPDRETMVCASPRFELFAFVGALRGALMRPGLFLADPLVLQLLLNVLLFLPLGFFLRVLTGRGILTALLVGLGLSLLVETAQLTGMWGFYPCAYREFDVDDLLTNTAGAVIGSLIALAVPSRHRGFVPGADTTSPQPVTRARKYLAMVCDVLGAWLTAFSVMVIVQAVLNALGATDAVRDGSAAETVGDVTAIVVWFVVTVTTGATVGDHAVRLRYEGGPIFVPIARFLRWAGGIGGYLVLIALPTLWGFVAALFAVASVIVVLTTPDRRGLPGVISGQRLVDAREPVVAPSDD